jgi:DNA-directed RNA polymerase alpha subunit
MSLEETVKFLKEVEEIRNYDLKMSNSNLSQAEFKLYKKGMLHSIRTLSNKYSDLDSPEAEYLKTLKNHYLNLTKKKKLTRDELKILDTPLKDMDFSVKTFYLLTPEIEYLGELVQKKSKDLLKRRSFGQKSLEEVKNLIGKLDYNLGMNINYVRPDKRN